MMECRLLAVASIAFASAAEDEALPDWLNIKIRIDQAKGKPQTLADHVALVKEALKQKTAVPVQLEFSKETLAEPVRLNGVVEASKEMSAKEYLEPILKGVQMRHTVWEKSGENGMKFVDVYLRTFKIYVEHQRKLEDGGPLSPERLAELLKGQGTPVSRYAKIIWRPEEGRYIMMDGLSSMVKLLSKIPGWSE